MYKYGCVIFHRHNVTRDPKFAICLRVTLVANLRSLGNLLHEGTELSIRVPEHRVGEPSMEETVEVRVNKE
jgi:hypothetical protein